MPGPKTAYRRGVQLERDVQRALQDWGYAVIRSAGSHSPVDMVAIGDSSIKLIQCKVGLPCRPYTVPEQVRTLVKGIVDWVGPNLETIAHSADIYIAHRCKRGVIGVYVSPASAAAIRSTTLICHITLSPGGESHAQA